MSKKLLTVLRYYIANILYLIGLAQIVPLITSLLLGESLIFIFIIGMILIVLVMFAWFLKHGLKTPPEINLVEAYIVTVIAFLVPAITCAIPIMVYGIDPLNALFEGVSAITTTGLSVLPENVLTPGVHFLRAYYQWLGGVSIALIVVSFLLVPGSSAYNIYMAHLGKYKLEPLSILTIKIILKIYVFFTIVFTIIYFITGLSLLDSVINALTTISTGGFSTIEEFDNNILYIAMILMFISAQPLALYYFFFQGKIRKILKDPQLKSFLLLVITSYVVIILSMRILNVKYLFQIISALSTTGYSALNNKLLPDYLKFLLSILMIIGAGFGSTGGGVKQLRIYILLKSLMSNIKKHTLPGKTISFVKIGEHIVSDTEIIYIYVMTMIYIITLILSTLIVSSYGYSFIDSLFECASALATTGLSTGISSYTLEPIPKIILIINMFIGRLEIIPITIILYKTLDTLRNKL